MVVGRSKGVLWEELFGVHGHLFILLFVVVLMLSNYDSRGPLLSRDKASASANGLVLMARRSRASSAANDAAFSRARAARRNAARRSTTRAAATIASRGRASAATSRGRGPSASGGSAPSGARRAGSGRSRSGAPMSARPRGPGPRRAGPSMARAPPTRPGTATTSATTVSGLITGCVGRCHARRNVTSTSGLPKLADCTRQHDIRVVSSFSRGALSRQTTTATVSCNGCVSPSLCKVSNRPCCATYTNRTVTGTNCIKAISRITGSLTGLVHGDPRR